MKRTRTKVDHIIWIVEPHLIQNISQMLNHQYLSFLGLVYHSHSILFLLIFLFCQSISFIKNKNVNSMKKNMWTKRLLLILTEIKREVSSIMLVVGRGGPKISR